MHLLKPLASIMVAITFLSAPAQTTEAIITELKAVNKNIVNTPCTATNTSAITHRAMNVFLADKTAYLSQSTDLSYYTNYVTFNSTEGRLTVNHNFQKATGTDEPIRSLFSVGISINVANAITPDIANRKHEKEAGFLIGYKWLAKVKTRFANCTGNPNTSPQKQAIDALRARLLYTLQSDLINKEAAFTQNLKVLDSTDVPSQSIDSVRAIMAKDFYTNLHEEYIEQFTKQQAEILTRTRNYQSIRTGWTTLSAYIPVVTPSYSIAPTVTVPFQTKSSYPATVTLSHTKMWESTKTGRWFFTLAGSAFLNNSKRSYTLKQVNLNQYQRLGGTDTIPVTNLKNDNAYIGTYKNFITSSLQARLVYFPPANSHIGISLTLEQHIGRYHPLNGKIGLPVILINSKKLPAANLEFYMLLFDINNAVKLANTYGSKTAIGLHIGIPLSRLMY